MAQDLARVDERLPQGPKRAVLIQQAFRLEWLTVAWMVIEALVAIGSGVIAGSLMLTAFGLDSVIELFSAGVLIWRLRAELRRGEQFSVPGLIVAVVAMPIMYVLARRKLDVARQLGSRAMRADAIESITCGWLSLVVVAGLVARLLFAAWWIDAVTSALSGSSSKKRAKRGAVRTVAATSEDRARDVQRTLTRSEAKPTYNPLEFNPQLQSDHAWRVVST